VSWGALHGLYLIMNNFIRIGTNGSGLRDGRSHSALRILGIWLLTQILICTAWVFFFVPDFKTAEIYFLGLLGLGGQDRITLSPLVWCCFIAFLIDHIYGWIIMNRPEWVYQIPLTMRAAAYILMLVFLYHAVPEKANPFIYFQF
jgi:hypothetical protein